MTGAGTKAKALPLLLLIYLIAIFSPSSGLLAEIPTPAESPRLSRVVSPNGVAIRKEVSLLPTPPKQALRAVFWTSAVRFRSVAGRSNKFYGEKKLQFWAKISKKPDGRNRPGERHCRVMNGRERGTTRRGRPGAAHRPGRGGQEEAVVEVVRENYQITYCASCLLLVRTIRGLFTRVGQTFRLLGAGALIKKQPKAHRYRFVFISLNFQENRPRGATCRGILPAFSYILATNSLFNPLPYA